MKESSTHLMLLNYKKNIIKSEKAAFTVVNYGFYECNRMVLSLTNTPPTFQKSME